MLHNDPALRVTAGRLQDFSWLCQPVDLSRYNISAPMSTHSKWFKLVWNYFMVHVYGYVHSYIYAYVRTCTCTSRTTDSHPVFKCFHLHWICCVSYRLALAMKAIPAPAMASNVITSSAWQPESHMYLTVAVRSHLTRTFRAHNQRQTAWTPSWLLQSPH